jgi:hypothetical protein
MSEQIQQKTGQTPEAVDEGHGPRVLRVAELKLAMVEYVDNNNPQPVIKPIALGPDGTVYFLDEKIVGKTAQKWFTDGVKKKMGK